MLKVSINIITYNREKMLEKAIIRASMQSFKDFEIVVVDDASEDNTEDLIKKYIEKGLKIKYFKNSSHLGISESRNRAVSMSSGEYIAVLDSDDFWIETDKLAKQVAMLDKDSELGIIGTNIVLVDNTGLKIGEDHFSENDTVIRREMLFKNQFAHSSIMFRKSIFEEVGGYDTSFSVCEDLDLILKIGKKTKLQNIQKQCTAYTIHNTSISKQRRQEIINTTDLIIEKYKKCYPNYIIAKIKSILRRIMTRLF